ncbi:ATP-binding cassette domain-containing protein [Cereibacter azotoformans]|uniref:Cell division ATP-binding protein FtsE n=1 Tax=Cereibacter azotoformans TaxID=43057 RepID=A0A2T5JT31_9RHOB|nr:ATP-binding cassette domain-containing protein [Cereibacter azotoformans]PTR12960.1 D-methionine transport system ATP-binding protein [Cereibacter azotoformans]UIJ32755.1 ATP-binding cassette domain-containing protein [Cereibacter azotoformans]
MSLLRPLFALPSTLAEAATGTPPAVAFEHVSKNYSSRHGQTPVPALRDVSVSVGPGSITGVIGPSGAGKSTLIRLVNGLEHATSGRVSLFGREVGALSEAEWRRERRSIGMIFQHFNLLSSRTVFQNVALPLVIAGVPSAQIRPRVERLLDLVGIADKRDRYPAELSGGQKQRVGIARALANDPRILLCDEATSALDPETTLSILRLLRQVNRDLGVTILLITHEIPVIKEICDRVAVLEAGRIVESGPVFDVFTRPATPIAARFAVAATGVDLPPEWEARKLAPGQAGAHSLVRITLAGQAGAALARLGALGPGVEIVSARIDSIGGRPFGVVLALLDPKTVPLARLRAALPDPRPLIEEIAHVA